MDLPIIIIDWYLLWNYINIILLLLILLATDTNRFLKPSWCSDWMEQHLLTTDTIQISRYEIHNSFSFVSFAK